MSAFLGWTTKTGQSKTMFFDVVTEEDQTLVSTATENPVEEGANVSDHIRKELDRVALDCFVSNQPVHDVNSRGGRVEKLPIKLQKYKPPLQATPGSAFGAAGAAIKDAVGSLLGGNQEYAAQVLQFPSSFDAVADTLQILEKLQDDRQLVEVVLPSKVYDNMFLEHLNVHRNAGSGGGASFRLEFKKIRKVEVRIVTAPVPTEVRGLVKKVRGAKGVVEAAAPAQKKLSVLKGLANSAQDFIPAEIRKLWGK
jgi:hypothetical protein